MISISRREPATRRNNIQRIGEGWADVYAGERAPLISMCHMGRAESSSTAWNKGGLACGTSVSRVSIQEKVPLREYRMV
jgi:hypothetical protein